MNTLFKLSIYTCVIAGVTTSQAYDIVDTGLALHESEVTLNNNSIVYIQNDAINTDIKTYEIASDVVSTVFSDANWKYTLDADNSGDIAWYQETFDPVTGASMSAIMLYNNTLGTTAQIYADSVLLAEIPKPQINESGDITWAYKVLDLYGYPTSSTLLSANVYKYSAATAMTNVVSASLVLGGVPVFDAGPSMNDAGNLVWVSQGQFDFYNNVFFQDAATSEISMVTLSSTITGYNQPVINNANQIAWELQVSTPGGIECVMEWSAGPGNRLAPIEFNPTCLQVDYGIMENGNVVYLKTDGSGTVPSELHLYNPTDESNTVLYTGATAYSFNPRGDIAWVSDTGIAVKEAATGIVSQVTSTPAAFIKMNDNGDLIWREQAATGNIFLAKNTSTTTEPPYPGAAELALTVKGVKLKGRGTRTRLILELAYNTLESRVSVGDKVSIGINDVKVLDELLPIDSGKYEVKNEYGKFELNLTSSFIEIKLIDPTDGIIDSSRMGVVSLNLGDAVGAAEFSIP